MLSGLSKGELHRGCPIVHEEHEERSHENTTQSITQELFFRLTNSENTSVQTWELSAANRYTTTLLALVGFQGRGLTDGIQPDFCHTLLPEALIFQWS